MIQPQIKQCNLNFKINKATFYKKTTLYKNSHTFLLYSPQISISHLNEDQTTSFRP